MSNTIKLSDLNNIISPSEDAEFWIYDPNSPFPRDRKLTFSNLYDTIKVAINNETPTLNLNINGNSNTVTDGVYTVGNQSISGEKTFQNLIEFSGIKNSVLEINKELSGNPPSSLVSGITITRGNLLDYRFIYRESDNSFLIGPRGNEQKISTREDSPQERGIAFWNSNESRFDTSENLSWEEDEYGSYLGIIGDLNVFGNLNIDGVLTKNGEKLFDFFSETIEGSEGYSDWTQDSETDPWIASIIINGIKETDRPIVDIDLSQEDFEDIPEFLSNWSLVYRVRAFENEIKLFALEEPEKNFNISIKVIR